MKKSIVAAALAAVGFVAAASGNAFADLQFVGAQNIPDSFTMTFVVNGGSISTPPFDKIVLTLQNNTTYTVTGQTFILSNRQPFEDIGAHDVFTSFVGGSGWAQTLPVGTPGAVSAATATGSTITSPSTLIFTVNFGDGSGGGQMSDGTHFLMDFYLGNTFRTGYEVKFKLGSTSDSSLQGTEIVNYNAIPLPPAVWSGLAMMAGLGVFLAKRRSNSKVLS